MIMLRPLFFALFCRFTLLNLLFNIWSNMFLGGPWRVLFRTFACHSTSLCDRIKVKMVCQYLVNFKNLIHFRKTHWTSAFYCKINEWDTKKNTQNKIIKCWWHSIFNHFYRAVVEVFLDLNHWKVLILFVSLQRPFKTSPVQRRGQKKTKNNRNRFVMRLERVQERNNQFLNCEDADFLFC